MTLAKRPAVRKRSAARKGSGRKGASTPTRAAKRKTSARAAASRPRTRRSELLNTLTAALNVREAIEENDDGQRSAWRSSEEVKGVSPRKQAVGHYADDMLIDTGHAVER
jgi:hypothetical protein